MLIGYMQVSKIDGSQVLDFPAIDWSPPASTSPDLMKTTPWDAAMTGRGSMLYLKMRLRDGDTLVVWKLDRLGRNLRHLVNVVHDLDRARHRAEGARW